MSAPVPSGSAAPEGASHRRARGRPPSHDRSARRWLWVAVVAVIGWFLVAGAVGPAAGDLSSAQKNDNATFLPASAEATRVIDEQAKFAGQRTLSVLAVIASDQELTPAQQGQAQQWVSQSPQLSLPGGKTVRDYLASEPVVVPSQDGKALLVTYALDGDAISTPMSDGKSPVLRVVEALRDSGTAELSGLTFHVTGEGGFLADLIAIFGEIDTKLLLVTAVVVALILILVYRSPFIWLIPLLSAGLALSVASAVVYLFATNDLVTLNGQSQGILTVLVFGAGTDYALLLVSRYREELHHTPDHVVALRRAWRGVVEPIVASAATVCIGLLVLLLSELNSNKSTGPVAALGIASALVVMLTFLPALLAVPSAVVVLLLSGAGFVLGAVLQGPALGAALAVAMVVVFVVGVLLRVRENPPSWAFWARLPAGRWAFWPKVPYDDEHDEKLSGLWSKVAGSVGRRPRLFWVSTTVLLLVLSGFVLTLRADGVPTTDLFADKASVDSIQGQTKVAQHFPAGAGSPAVVIGNADQLDAMVAAAKSVPGVDTNQVVPYTGQSAATPQSGPAEPLVVDGRVRILVTLTNPPDSQAAQDTVVALRDALHAVPGADALVGGATAVNYDTQQASIRDRDVVIPLVLLVIFVILMILLRSVLAPVLLIATVLLSYFATLGLSALFFNHVFGFSGADPSFPLFTFVFLVALGIDYNIFLMTRVREESQKLGTRPGILKGLTVTGGVITSAGVVLAATFGVLGVLPLVILREIGFAVAAGVLLDTLVVRSLLVPALSYDVGPRIWWPSALRRRPDVPESEQAAAHVPSVTTAR